jgi:hypothetical protein
VPRPAINIPKAVIGELNVNVIGAGPELNMLNPSTEGELLVPKKTESQKSEPLHETAKLGYRTDVAVLEIGELKSCRTWCPAAAKYGTGSVNVITVAEIGLAAISTEQAA